MIKISRSLKKDTKEWSEKEWHKLDNAHYGHRVDWNEQKFRFKAEENGKVIGYISGKHESGVLYIGQIIIKTDYRGKGVGSKLIDAAENFGKKFGAHMIWLITGNDWPANSFYKKLGFKLTATLPDFHFHKDFVIYTRPIK